MKRERIILHIDMDAFFASVEQACNPSLRGLPVMVCGGLDTRTVVAAASYPARKYGVHSGMPLAVARAKCPRGVFIEGTPEKYVYVSLKVNEIFSEFTPIVEKYSIDESFLDVTDTVHLCESRIALSYDIKRRIRDELDLTCTVGIGPNKLLAKMASKFHKPDGICTLMKEDVPDKLHPLPVGKLFGIGDKTAGKLERLGVDTIGRLAKMRERPLRQIFGVVGPMLRRAANGIDDSPVLTDAEQPQAKSVGNNYTFQQDTNAPERINRVLLALCAKVARRLRKGGYAGRTVTVRIRFADFRTITRARTAGDVLNLDKEIYSVARDILAPFLSGEFIRLIGVSVSKLICRHVPRQKSLFDHKYRRRYRDAISAVDKVRDKFGERSLVWARMMPGRSGTTC